MKKYLLLLLFTTSLAVPPVANAQQQKPGVSLTQRQDTTQADELEAFSDTTSTTGAADSVASPAGTSVHSTTVSIDADDIDSLGEFLRILGDDPTGLHVLSAGFLVLGFLFILFVLAPLAVLGLLFFFIYKNRKQKMRLAEEAMKRGQPIPDQLFNEQRPSADMHDDMRSKGIRQTCLGVGLMILLGTMIGDVGYGVGALVTAIGIGNLFIARSQSGSRQQGM